MIDYQHSLLSISASIQKKYGMYSIYQSLDLSLEKYKKVVLILMDGMGVYNMPDHGFLKSHQIDVLSSTFPPTTVAATTALRTGKSPLENGWIGWMQYSDTWQHHYIMFLNKDFYTGERSSKSINEMMDYHPFYEHLPVPAYEIYPAFQTPGMKTFANQVDYLNELLSQNEECFIYVYQDEYDSLMHKYGPKDPKVQEYYQYIEKQCQRISYDQDTIILITADHGHIDIDPICLLDYKDIMDCMRVYPGIEGRAVSFYIYPDKLEQFQSLFKQYFSRDFMLLTHDEVFNSHLLGYGKEYPMVHDFIGDYFALATTNKLMTLKKDYPNKGNHAGYTKEELEIPLIVLKQ